MNHRVRHTDVTMRRNPLTIVTLLVTLVTTSRAQRSDGGGAGTPTQGSQTRKPGTPTQGSQTRKPGTPTQGSQTRSGALPTAPQ
jgi:hypothetical protein